MLILPLRLLELASTLNPSLKCACHAVAAMPGDTTLGSYNDNGRLSPSLCMYVYTYIYMYIYVFVRGYRAHVDIAISTFVPAFNLLYLYQKNIRLDLSIYLPFYLESLPPQPFLSQAPGVLQQRTR